MRKFLHLLGILQKGELVKAGDFMYSTPHPAGLPAEPAGPFDSSTCRFKRTAEIDC